MTAGTDTEHPEAADARERRSPLSLLAAPRARRLVIFGAIILLPFYLLARLFWIGAWSSDRKLDIYYHFSEGKRIAEGVNPYERIMAGDMVRNDKYATLLPPTYLLFAGFAKAGCGYVEFLLYWRILLHLSHFAVGCLILWRLSAHSWLLGTFGLWFWLFNRWSVMCLLGSYLEPFTVIFPVLALVLMPNRFRLACLVFGIGIGFKHVGIFAAPLFLVWGWQRGRWREAGIAAAALALPAVLSALPFVLMHPEAFMRSMLFSGTRRGDDMLWIPVQPLQGAVVEAIRRLPVVVLCLLVYGAAWRGKIGPAGAMFLAFAAFVFFNSILFMQYYLWPLAILPFAVTERLSPAEPSLPSPQ